MKLLIFGDTHGRVQPMLDVLADEAADAVACFHLGDGVRDTDAVHEAFPALPLYVVRGNCDFDSDEPDEGVAPFGGLLIYYTHGHQLDVKRDLDKLWWRARQQGADIALYGHTHVAGYSNQNGLHLFTPGSISQPRFGTPSYGVLTIAGGVPTFDVRHPGGR